MNEKLVVSASPHIKAPQSIDIIMRDVLIALIPPLVVSVWLFGFYSLSIVVLATVTAMLTEILLLRSSFNLKNFIGDGSAAVTGMILGLSLPPGTPWWMIVIGSVIAIGIGKQLFGGIGFNIFNPALVGRAFLVVAFPSYMTHWTAPSQTVDFDAATAATPLAAGSEAVSYWENFVGDVAGSIGETSILAILIGAAFLLIRGHIDIRVPVGYMGAVALIALLVPGEDVIFNVFSGSAFFAAVYMATCMVTSPYTKNGKLIFGIGCGLLTVIFRIFGANPEGVTYAILLMNALVPFINKFTKPKIYGEVSG